MDPTDPPNDRDPRAPADADGFSATILESMTDAFVLLGADWRFQYVNAAFERMNGVRRADVLGRDHWELYPATRGTVLEAEYRRAVAERATVEFENRYAPWDRWFAVKAFPAGTGLGVQVREITAAKRAAAELARREEELRLVTDAVPALICYVDAGGVYRFVNRQYEEWFARPRGQVVGRHMRELLGEAAFAAVRPAVERALAGERFEYETFAPYPSGGRHIHAEYVPRVEDGRVVGFFALVTDVSERRAAERGQRFLAELAAATQPLEDPDEVIAVTARMLGEYLGCDRCAYAEVEGETVFHITGNYTRGVPSIVGRWPVADFGPEVVRLMAANEPYVMGDAAADPRAGTDLSAYAATTIRAVICVPLHKGGRFAAAMAVHQRTPRHWTPDEVDLVRLVVARCWESLERTRVARDLRASREQLGLMFASVKDYAIFTTDPTGVVTTWNAGAEAIFGWAEGEIVGQPVEVLFSPEDRASGMALAERQRAADTGRGASERWHVKKDGTRFFASGVTTPLRDGGLRGFVKVARDVTDRQRAAEALVASEERLAQLIRVMPSFTAVLRGPAHVFELANAPYFALVGRGPEIVGRPVIEALPEIADQPFPALLERVYRTGEPFEAKGMRVLLARGPGGALDEVFVDFVYSPLREADGAVSGILIHGVDRTVQVRAEAALKEADARKDEFIATLAHELRNPLAPVRTALAALRRAPSPGAFEKAREMMDRQIGHMVRLIDDLLDVSRITRGKIELKRERVDVRAVLDAAVEVSRPHIDAGKHELRLSVPDAALALDADPTRLAQVVSNLLNNAAKYTPAGGRIELSAAPDGDAVVIRVCDTGVGIAADALPRVWEMFTQVGHTTDRAQGGLGIGLGLVARLVELHGGTVAAESAGPGHGSTFTVRLPLAKAEVGGGKAETKPEGGTGSSSAFPPPTSALRKVLIVDDNVDGAESLADLLALGGYTTATAHTGPDALARAREFAPDVAILDIGMPGMSGYEVARRLRADAAFDGLTLIALTGWGTDDDRRQAHAAGFDHHLTKPVDAARVEALLAGPGRAPGRAAQ